MAALPFNLNDSLHFPPYSRTKNVNEGGENNNDQTCIDDLNDTLLELIFISFQWRQLATFKCVSKRWNSIISNPDFLGLLPLEHSAFTIYLRGKKDQYSYDKSCGTTCLVTEHPYFQRHKLGLDFLPTDGRYYYERTYIDIVANHKDLLVSYRYLQNEETIYYAIANPLTKQFIEVPLTRTQALDESPSYINQNLYWPPCWVVGFAGVVEGVSTTTSEIPNSGFRIVRILGYSAQKIQIYSSKTGQWTWYTWNCTCFYCGCSKMSVTLNDKIYYQGWSKILVIDPFDDDDDDIVTPRIINLPDEIKLGKSVLGVSQNRLHLAQFEDQLNTWDDYPRIKVWEFQDYYNELTVTKMADLRLVINFPLKPYLFERIIPPIFRIFPPIESWRWSDRVICCHPYDPHIVYFFYGDTFYRCDVVKEGLKVVSYYVDNWNETYLFLHPLMTPK